MLSHLSQIEVSLTFKSCKEPYPTEKLIENYKFNRKIKAILKPLQNSFSGPMSDGTYRIFLRVGTYAELENAIKSEPEEQLNALRLDISQKESESEERLNALRLDITQKEKLIMYLTQQNDEKSKTITKSLIDDEELEKKNKKLTKALEETTSELNKQKITLEKNEKLLELIDPNATLENHKLMKEIMEMKNEKIEMMSELKEMMSELKEKNQELNALRKALVSAYEWYGGLTARVVVDKFYEFFMEMHVGLDCAFHDSLFIDLANKTLNKKEISNHWKICTRLVPGKRDFLKKFTTDLWNVNFFLNNYIHREQINEIIVPPGLDGKLLREIYEFEKENYEKNVNGKKDDEKLEFVLINRALSDEQQIRSYYFYKAAKGI